MERDRRIDREIERYNEETDSSASIPGRIRINWFRYARAFPHQVLWWFVVLGGIALLGISVHPLFFVLAFPTLIWMNRHRDRLSGHFLSGCVNPGQVVSLDPPLIAVSTDLSYTDDPYPVVKILGQPLSLLTAGPAEVGQRVATVALYMGDEGDTGHWWGFVPIVADAATGNRELVQTTLDRLGDTEWEELRVGLAQVPTPYEPGTYRIYHSLKRQMTVTPTREDIENLLVENLRPAKDSCCHFAADGIPDGALTTATESWAAGAECEDVLALLESYATEGAESGLLITGTGIWYGFPETGDGSFEWPDLVGSLADPRCLEIMLADERRLRIPERHFLTDTMHAVDVFLDDIRTM